MRLTVAALPLLALVVPLPAAAADRDAERVAATLSDPAVQDRMADTVTALVGALMQMPVGPLANAVARIDPDSDAAYIPRDATVGDIAGRNSHDAERMGDDVRAGTRMAGRAASALATYAPVLKDMARDLSAQWTEQWERERASARQ